MGGFSLIEALREMGVNNKETLCGNHNLIDVKRQSGRHYTPLVPMTGMVEINDTGHNNDSQ